MAGDSIYDDVRASARQAMAQRMQTVEYTLSGMLKTVVRASIPAAISVFESEGYIHLRTENQGREAVLWFVMEPSIAMTTLDKTCPRCAETIKLGASVCRFCGHEFH